VTENPTDGNNLEAIIAAAGLGERLGRGPKAFVKLRGTPLICWIVAAVAPFCARITVAVPTGSEAAARQLLPAGVNVVAGGLTRVETLTILASAARKQTLLIHDVAHPLSSPALIRKVIDAARLTGAACAALPMQSSVRIVEPQDSTRPMTMGRNMPGNIWITQKPAVVPRAALLKGLSESRGVDPPFGAIDLVILAGLSVTPVTGDPSNIKITTPDDLALAERIADGLVGQPAGGETGAGPSGRRRERTRGRARQAGRRA
jgi:2-C-methyl-D-erythritol 4-phosphate cytidylyltransferase